MTVKEERESADAQRLVLAEKVDDLIIRFDRLDDSVTGLDGVLLTAQMGESNAF